MAHPSVPMQSNKKQSDTNKLLFLQLAFEPEEHYETELWKLKDPPPSLEGPNAQYERPLLEGFNT